MKHSKLVAALAVAMLATACSTVTKTAETKPAAAIPSPTPVVVKDQTVAAQGKVENSASIDIPAWYIKAPASTEDYVFITGTAISSDLAMSRTKAMLDSQVQLAEKINGIINAMVKQSKQDNGGTVGTDRTTLTVKKIVTDTAITGMHLEDSKVMTENRGYRTFVLVRYPMGDANRMLKDKMQQERLEREGNDSSEHELDREIELRRKPVVKRQESTTRPPVETVDISRSIEQVELKAQ